MAVGTQQHGKDENKNMLKNVGIVLMEARVCKL